jgi:hypothetical protein
MNILSQILSGINRADFYIVLTIATFVYLARKGMLPSTESIRRLTSMLDDRGGNILVLMSMTIWFVAMTGKLFYYSFHEMESGVLKPDNAILLMALNTMSGTFAGTCFGALLKTMSGSMTVAPPNASTAGGMSIASSPQLMIGSPAGVASLTLEHPEVQNGGLQHAV